VKTIGLIGGMSWESSLEYYRILNETIKVKLGGLHSAKCILYSVDFAEIEALQHEGKWDEAAAHMVAAGRSLERAGADFIVLCTNTMHKLADALQGGVRIPLLHIADATAQQIRSRGLKTIGLLGTRFTMEQEFYKGRLTDRYGLNVMTPDSDEREAVHRIIYDELCLGVVKADSRATYVQIMERMVQSGAEGIILGCTEIELLVREGDCRVPVFPTTRIHAVAAVEFALALGKVPFGKGEPLGVGAVNA
jgi:aspartate racemase